MSDPSRRRADREHETSIADRLEHLEGLHTALRFEFEAFTRHVTEHMKVEAINTETLQRMEQNLAGNTANTNEMYAIFAGAVMGFKVLGWIGRQIMRFITFMGKIAKPMFYIVAIGMAMWGYLAGKGWTWPAWMKLP